MSILRRGAFAFLAPATALTGGCASSIDSIESAATVERSIQAEWAGAGARSSADLSSEIPGPIPDDPPLAVGESSTLSQCRQFALLNSPEVESAFYRWQASRDRIPQVTALPDPRVSYGYYVQEVETRVGPQEQRVAVSQTLPWFGKLDIAGDMAAEAANAELARLHRDTLTIL